MFGLSVCVCVCVSHDLGWGMAGREVSYPSPVVRPGNLMPQVHTHSLPWHAHTHTALTCTDCGGVGRECRVTSCPIPERPAWIPGIETRSTAS